MRIPARTIAPRICAALLPSALLLSGTLHSAEAGINVWTTSGPEGGGVIKTAEGGGSWSTASTRLASTIVRASAIDPQAATALAAGTSNGVFKSTDGAGTWSPASNGLANLPVNALAIDPQTPT